MVTYRPGTEKDAYDVYRVFKYAITDLDYRKGALSDPVPEADDVAEGWENMASIYGYLGTSAETFWVAEDDDGVIGYARAIERDGLQD